MFTDVDKSKNVDKCKHLELVYNYIIISRLQLIYITYVLFCGGVVGGESKKVYWFKKKT